MNHMNVPRRIHIDTDIGGDIDDLCALAMVLNWPEVEIVGITTVSEVAGRRAGYVRYVLDLADRGGIPVAAGADVELGCYRHWRPGLHRNESAYWPEAIQSRPGPVEDALSLLQHSVERGATVIALGPHTNLALLEKHSPGSLSDAQIVMMGGFVVPPRKGFPQFGRELDYNIQVDPVSAMEVLSASTPTLVTLSITVETALRRSWLPRLRNSGSLGQLVARQAEAFAIEEPIWSHYGETCQRLPKDLINFLHDPLACAVGLGWNDGVEIQDVLLKSEIRNNWIYQSVESAGRPARIVSGVDGSRFSEFWCRTVCGEER